MRDKFGMQVGMEKEEEKSSPLLYTCAPQCNLRSVGHQDPLSSWAHQTSEAFSLVYTTPNTCIRFRERKFFIYQKRSTC